MQALLEDVNLMGHNKLRSSCSCNAIATSMQVQGNDILCERWSLKLSCTSSSDQSNTSRFSIIPAMGLTWTLFMVSSLAFFMIGLVLANNCIK